MEIIQMNDNSWRIEDQGVRCFLLTGNEAAALVDTGMGIQGLRKAVSALTDLPLILVNTHADRDHVGANGEFPSCAMHPDEEEQYRAQGGTGEILPLVEGDQVDLGGRVLEVIHLPGHTPGSIALLDKNARVLISGDPIQEQGRIFMFGPKRDLKSYIESLKRLEKRAGEFDEIWPSHANIPVSPTLIGPHWHGAEDILAGKVKGRAETMFGMPILAYDLGFSTFLCDAPQEQA